MLIFFLSVMIWYGTSIISVPLLRTLEEVSFINLISSIQILGEKKFNKMNEKTQYCKITPILIGKREVTILFEINRNVVRIIGFQSQFSQAWEIDTRSCCIPYLKVFLSNYHQKWHRNMCHQECVLLDIHKGQRGGKMAWQAGLSVGGTSNHNVR